MKPKEPAAITPPDGGYGWVIVLCSLLCQLTFVSGLVTFSVYITEFTHFFHDRTQAEIGLLGSVGAATGWLMAIPSGSLTKMFGCRSVCIAGLCWCTFGLVGAAFTSNFYLFLFLFGFVKASGYGIIFVPSSVIVQQYFVKKRALAVGLASCGMSIGPMIFAPIHRVFINIFGWRGGLIMFGGVCVQMIVFACLMRPVELTQRGKRRKTPETRELVDMKKTQTKETEEKEDDNSTNETENNKNSDVDKSLVSHNDDQKQSPISQEEVKPPAPSLGQRFINNIVSSFDVSLLKTPMFLLYMFSRGFAMAGPNVMYSYSGALAIFSGTAKIQAAVIIGCIGIGATVGRSSSGAIASFKCVNRLAFLTIVICCGAVIVVFCPYIASDTYIHMAATLCFGLCLGCLDTLFTIVATDLFGLKKLPGCLAWSIGLVGFMAFLYIYLTGVMFDVYQNYNVSFAVIGAIEMFGGLLCLLLCIWDGRNKAKHKHQELKDRVAEL